MMKDNNVDVEITFEPVVVVVDGCPKVVVSRYYTTKQSIKEYVESLKNKKIILMSIRRSKLIKFFEKDSPPDYTLYIRSYDLI